jgi:hypothetical protein
MRNSLKILFVTTAALACLSLSACKKEAPPAPPVVEAAPPPAVVEPAPVAVTPAVSVASVDLGRAVAADKTISDPTTTFAANDTIHASVATSGSVAGNSRLAAKWTYQTGDVVKEDSVDLQLTGPAVTQFSISNPKAWPVGNYKVEISLNGAVVQTKDFEVK